MTPRPLSFPSPKRTKSSKPCARGDCRIAAAWLRSRLLAWIEVGKQLEVGVPVDDLDPETVKSLKALGYLQ